MTRFREVARRSVFIVTALVLMAGLGSRAASCQDPTDPKSSGDWRLLGSFSGAAESNLAQQVWDLLVEMENDGDLYQDLGALSLGLGTDLGDDTKVDWDNYFTRRVYPMHEDLPPGSELTGTDISRYMDLQTVVSRGRLRHAYIPDIVDTHGVEFQIEGGVSLSLSRARSPLQLGDRPYEEVIAEREVDDFRTLSQAYSEPHSPDLLFLSAKGVRAATQWLADSVGRTADTERAELFWESYGDPATLGFDLGLPVKADLFSSSDPRLHPGDQVRHISFIGFSPVSMVLKEFGFRVETRYFLRYLRETTIIEEDDEKVLISVRNLGMRGGELIPLKLRPEVRLFGIAKLGYTFFEERWERGKMASSDHVYRVDLSHPRGRESLEAFLGDGRKISFRPLEVAAAEREGVERVDWRTHQGDMRAAFRRAQFFTPYRYNRRKMTSIQKINLEDYTYNELTIARNTQHKKSWGRDRNWRRQFLLQAITDPRLLNDPTWQPSQNAASVKLLTTYRDSYADVDDLRRAAAGIEKVKGPHPALDALVDMPPDETQKAFVNVEIRLGSHHLGRIRESSEEEVWEILAETLLGPEHALEWSTPAARDLWRRRSVRREFAAKHRQEVEQIVVPTVGAVDIEARYRLAKRLIKKFDRVRDLLEDGDCTSCAHAAFRKWKDLGLLQGILYRLGSKAEGLEPGYHYEVFADRMLRPVTVTNEVRHDFVPEEDPDNLRGIGVDTDLTAEQYEQDVRTQKKDWFGRKNFLAASPDRLQAGFLYKREDPVPEGEEEYCLKIRLFTDYVIEPGLSVRVDLREERTKIADITLRSSRFRLGDPEEIVETPFRTARYHYDVPIPYLDQLEPDTAHTILVRILNSDGYPVTEEQQIRFRSYKEGMEGVAEGCTLGTEQEIAISVAERDPEEIALD